MRHSEPIAVVGMSGVFPGANDLNLFWDNLINKRDAVANPSPDRWIAPSGNMVQAGRNTPDKAYSRQACLISDFSMDPEGLNIDPVVFKALDTLYHLVLYTGKTALEQCSLSCVDKENIGVCLAAIVLPTDGSTRITRQILGRQFSINLFGSDRFNPLNHQTASNRQAVLSAKVAGFPATLLAKALNLGGGAFTLDAACASSLYAVKIACDELLARRADVMLTGGVSRPDALFTQVGFSQLQALSPSGRCAPFDESADGLVVGEGAGILALKRVSDAIEHNDKIYGLIRGIGLSNDIRGNLLAPDIDGQVRAMQQAYDNAGWRPDEVDHIECHGAGTPVGDRVELTSLRELWKDTKWTAGQCAIGSVKSAIGHLLTGAGAAGIIKTLLAFSHQTLPPSLNFTRPPKNSPLHESPFRVQTNAAPWPERNNHTPRRAAVSAFGFGGINGHLLLEEWSDANLPRYMDSHGGRYSIKNAGALKSHKNSHSVQSPDANTPVAIIGMDTVFGSLPSLRAFQEAVFKGDSAIQKRPGDRWKGCDDLMDGEYGLGNLCGGFMERFDLFFNEFHIPPKEIPDILPQQLLMLKVAAGAMKDAGMPLSGKRLKMSALVGIGFDFETTNFHLRWALHGLVRKWDREYGLGLTDIQLDSWCRKLMDEMGPPLTAVRTIGDLGSIVASRIAREFQFGGPSFSISNDEASGLKALDLGVRSLRARETDAVLVGAVDLFGDARSIICRNTIRPFSKSNHIKPFDLNADGTLPGEGAAALVLKRLNDAVNDGNRIYAVIQGLGKATNGFGDIDGLDEKTYIRSMTRAFSDAGFSPDAVSLIETHGSGDPGEDILEYNAFHAFFNPSNNLSDARAMGSVKPVIGHTGAVAGLASIVKTALCLYQEIIAPISGYVRPKTPWDDQRFHLPAASQYWLKDSENGSRNALVCAMTTDGNCMHAVMSEIDRDALLDIAPQVISQMEREREKPAGFMPYGLFTVTAPDKAELMARLNALCEFIESSNGGIKPMEAVARDWHRSFSGNSDPNFSIVLIIGKKPRLDHWISRAKQAVSDDTPMSIIGPEGIFYSPAPLGPKSRIAFIYPGSGNHYVGMGRDIGVSWPGVLRKMGDETPSLKTQMLPRCFVPWRATWENGWEKQAYDVIVSDPLHMIFGQVVYGCLMTDLVSRFNVRPDAVIGYSLGQSAGYFALKAWPDRQQMLDRMRKTDLFTVQLAGPCNAARKIWHIPPDENVNWCAAVVNRPVDDVIKAVNRHPLARLLIVNTSNQCVIGGRKADVDAAINDLACESVFLDGVVTVHCDAAIPAADDYKALHVFPVTKPEKVAFYCCAHGRAQTLTSQSAAESILKQAIEGFDFTRTIQQAYDDGVRIFIEMGPHASCTGMIRNILKDRPHLAASVSFRGENEYLTVIKCLGALVAEHIPVDLEAIYGDAAYPQAMIDTHLPAKESGIAVSIGGKTPSPALPEGIQTGHPKQTSLPTKNMDNREDNCKITQAATPSPGSLYRDIMAAIPKINDQTAKAHETYLTLSSDIGKNQANAFELSNRLIEILMSNPNTEADASLFSGMISPDNEPAFSRKMCLEFAVGSVAKVLGPAFAVIDTYEKRVRLPDEPLMLVDRILSIEGEKCSLGGGKIITEHDVLAHAWYLDGGKAPVCISVEAGQADLFLCSFLGIDHQVKGKRAYRLLDATVEFHSKLPEPGDTIRYDIEIERFVRQGETYLFFFHFKGMIRNMPLITMTDGCAGFFTDAEVKKSGGILRTGKGQHAPGPRTLSHGIYRPVLFKNKHLSDHAVSALRKGDAAACFGPDFAQITIPDNLRLPGGRMKLIDRVLHMDPFGGRYGLGVIRAEADIHPDDWFLTCHFKDDMVMPGTLMYECCAHTLRIFLQQMGWISENPGACYEPKIGIPAVLKCRGPVTPQTRHVHYEVEIKQIGYDPEPYVLADAHMYADSHCIVMFKNISLKLSHTTEDDLRRFWEKYAQPRAGISAGTSQKPLFDRKDLLEFALGSPSKAFGAPYKPFDRDRFIARLPNPPYLLMDRIIRCDPQPWVLKPDGWVEAQFDVSPAHWYFFANKSDTMPFAVLIEIALQPCGWLAAYMGSALKSNKDLKFRNLDGIGVLYAEVPRKRTTLTTLARLKQVSTAGDMIIEAFEFKVVNGDVVIYAGNTSFGFFSQQAMLQQKGIRDAEKRLFVFPEKYLKFGPPGILKKARPLIPDDPDFDSKTHPPKSPCLPAKALLMIDTIEAYIPDGGPSGLGLIRGIKKIDPDEWFFSAHFLQDPVCPGSLGIESFIQLLKFIALERWNGLTNYTRFEMMPGKEHGWSYRGQILRQNKQVEVEAMVTEVRDTPLPAIVADGFLKVDGMVIYEMKNFGIRAVKE